AGRVAVRRQRNASAIKHIAKTCRPASPAGDISTLFRRRTIFHRRPATCCDGEVYSTWHADCSKRSVASRRKQQQRRTGQFPTGNRKTHRTERTMMQDIKQFKQDYRILIQTLV
ncbi:MAG: hypothetical protein ACREUK_03580, partial [Burkholderiales bacterium]